MNKLLFLVLIIALVALNLPLAGQSLTTGDVAGVITDTSGAVMPGSTVTLRSLDTGATQTIESGSSGEYRFRLLKPGHYVLTASQTGFENSQRTVDVNLGAVTTANLTLQVGQATQTVEVTGAVPLLNPDPSNNTSFTAQQVAMLPSAGGDITTIAFTAPGAVVNNTGGYGNFTVNGLPATSNLFTINGENDMDPYFNINNSGATNLTIGQNELQEATIVSNAYSGQYGQLSGAQVTYITRSGTNEFHGDLKYWWNGRAMNANNWLNNSGIYGYTPRPFSNSNQWAGAVGGPVFKNQTFFFFDTEGLRFVIPNNVTVTIPTKQFANAVLANVQARQPKEFSTYQQMMNLWQNAPGSGSAQPIANSTACNSLNLAGFDPTTQSCAARYLSTPTALAKEWVLAFKVDHRFSDHDTAFFRYKQDRGTQPTTIDPINANFDALSTQPSWDTQVNETHIFGPTMTNSFMATLSYYSALFSQNEKLVNSTFPTSIITSGSVPFSSFNQAYAFPQGRKITQYQIIDDFTLIQGKHNLKFGENFRRYDVSDHNFTFVNPGVYFGYVSGGLQEFADGLAYQYRKTAYQSNDVPIALWGIGAYAQDEWALKPNFKLTMALRIEHNANPVCNFFCFANLRTSFNQLPSFTSPKPTNVPYSADIQPGLRTAFPRVNAIDWSPRIGFNWSPFNDKKTVISGGFGIFYDNLASGFVDAPNGILANPPSAVAIRVRPAGGTVPFDPSGAPATWAASAAAFSLNKTYSQIAAQLHALGAVFSPPAVAGNIGTMKDPEFQEWNFQIQRQLSNTLVIAVNYVGNHGVRIPYTNQWGNAFDLYGIYPGVPGVPSAVPVPNYGTATQYQSGARSSYHGLNVSFTKQFSHGVAAHFNYTWSHAIDEVSNGGIFTYGDSLLGQISPLGLRANNYGNADYDIRHNFNADFTYAPIFHTGKRFADQLVDGWQWSGKLYWRTGLPFSVVDGNAALGNFAGSLLATYTGGQAQTSCGAGATTVPCINASAFLDSSSINNFTALSSQNRNMFRGPHYFDVDMALFRNFKIKERVQLAIGLQAFNAFNHPNFGQPDYTLGDATFGQITSMAGTPTSPYGTFLGFDSSPRIVQLSGKIVF